MGDFNVRVGTMHDDVPDMGQVAMPPALLADAPSFFNVHQNIPTERQNMDKHVPDRQAAMDFLQGLNAVHGVLLNGRVAGDQQGQYTFVRRSTDGCVVGSSTIDFAIVCATLYGSVRKLTVCDHHGSMSTDHCPLSLQLALQPSHHAIAVGMPQRRPIVYRPVGPANTALYCEALSMQRPAFQQVLRDMQGHVISIAQGLQQLTDIVVHCLCQAHASRQQHQSC
jgi:hypothetical protein